MLRDDTYVELWRELAAALPEGDRWLADVFMADFAERLELCNAMLARAIALHGALRSGVGVPAAEADWAAVVQRTQASMERMGRRPVEQGSSGR